MAETEPGAVEVPDLIEPVCGWRAWYVDRPGGSFTLRSMVFDARWPVGRALVAECMEIASGRRRGLPWRRIRHDAPHARCDCGIYGTTSLTTAKRYFDGASYPQRWPAQLRAFGFVSLWGSVVECERGFRASHAYPSLLYVPQVDRSQLADEVAADLGAYGVPVEVVDCREEPFIVGLARSWTRLTGRDLDVAA